MAEFTVVLNSQPAAALAFSITRSNTRDIALVPQTVFFLTSNWSTAQTVTVRGLEDGDADNEAGNILISRAITGELYHTLPYIVLDDERPTLAFSAGSYSVQESGGNVVSLTVNISPQLSVTSSVTVQVAGGTATQDTDYTLSTAVLSLPASMSTASFTVTGMADRTTEGAETIALQLAAVSSAPYNLGAPSAAEVVIEDNSLSPPPPGTLTLRASTLTPAEGTAVTVTAVLDNPAPGGDTTVTLTPSGTAAAGGGAPDYRLSSDTITIAAGEREGMATLTIVSDSVMDGGETILLAAASTNPVLTAVPITLTITDVPPLPPSTLTLTVSPTASPTEGINTGITLTAALDNPAPAGGTVVTVTVDAGSTATVAEDYRLSSSTITIAAGEQEGTATLTIVDDAAVEAAETILLDAASTNPVLTARRVTVSITDDDMQGSSLDGVSQLLAPELSRLLADGAVGAVARRIARTAEEVGAGGAAAGAASRSGGPAAVASDFAGGLDGPASGVAVGAATAAATVAAGATAKGSAGGSGDAAVPGGRVHQHVQTLAALSEGRLSLAGLAQLLDGSEFVLPLHRAGQAGQDSKAPAWLSTLTLWGGGEYRRLENDSADLNWEADTVSARVGLDARIRDHWLLGAAVAWGRGTVDDPGEEAPGEEAGGGLQEYRLTLGSVLPYLAWTPKEGVQLWLSGGYGQGTVRLRGEAQSVRSDATQHLAAGGARVRLLVRGRTRLHLRLEGQGVWLDIDGSGGSGAAQAGGPRASELSAHKVQTRTFRALLEGRRTVVLARGVLTPALELGVRHDGGDGDSGAAALVGGALRYRGLRGLQAQAGGELLAGRSDYREWGVWGFVSWEQGADGRGWSLRLSPRYGPGHGLGHGPGGSDGGFGNGGRLWQRGAAGVAGLGSAGALPAPASGRLDLRIGYGLAKGPRLLAPYSELSLADEARRLRLGVQWRPGGQWRLDLAGERLERTGADTVSSGASARRPEHRILLEGRLRY